MYVALIKLDVDTCECDGSEKICRGSASTSTELVQLISVAILKLSGNESPLLKVAGRVMCVSTM